VLARAPGDPAWAALADHLGLVTLPRTNRAMESRVSVSLYAILKFLEFPLQGWASFRLGLDDDEEEDLIAREDEPFETHYRDETMFLRGVLLESKRSGRPIAQVYDDAVRAKEIRGAGPAGAFARGERGDHLRTLETWTGQLGVYEVPLSSIEVHRFGRASERSQADRVREALAIDVDFIDPAGVARVLRADLGGNTSPLGGTTRSTARVSLALAKRAEETDEWARAGRQRAALRAFIDHAVLAASGATAEGPHESLSVVATADGSLTDHLAFAPLSRGEATAWLRDVVRDLLCTSHAYFLPCEAVFLRDMKNPSGSIAPFLRDAQDKLTDSDGPPALRSAYGPVPRVAAYPPPSEEAAEAMIARRFGRFFQKRTKGPNGPPRPKDEDEQ
jgi:exodeoxyribonuclease V gamma subunit